MKIFKSFCPGTGRDRGVCPGTFAPALVPGQRDSGTGKTFLSRDKGTTGQGNFFVPGQRDNGTGKFFCPGTKGQRDAPSRFVPGRPAGRPVPWKPYIKPTRAKTQYAIVAQDEGVEMSEESEKDIEVKPVVNQVIETSAVHSELDYDQEEVENDPEEFECYKDSEESRAQIKEEPQSEEGYEQDREINNESEEEAPASPPRQVIFRDTPAGRRRRRFKMLRKARREKIQRHQATKSAKLRLGDGMAGRTNRRSRTPSMEIMSDEENEVTPRNQSRVSPDTTAKMARNNRTFLRDLKKSRRKVKLAGEEDNASIPSDSEDEDDKLDKKVSRNQKHQSQYILPQRNGRRTHGCPTVSKS